MSSDLTKIDSVGGVPIYSVSGAPKSFIFKTGFAIDADGSPNAYGPNNSGLDYTANGGDDQGGNWWGGPTGSDGKPLVQKIYEPSPGMYVSGTSLLDPAYTDDSQYRYIDSGSIPFFVLPGNHANGAKLGDCGLVYNEKTGDNCYAIYADVGPSSKIGEGSMRLAKALALNPDPKKGGTETKCIVYLIFPVSIGKWTPPKIWFDTANTLTEAWGGVARLKELAKQL
jgi:Fungal chitosanase of glycosyl hydrolase group 75